MKRIGLIALRQVGVLVLFDLIGVVACTVFDIVPIRGNSPILPYAVWMVLGVFFGVFGYQVGGSVFETPGKDWSSQPDSGKKGAYSLFVGIGLLTLLFGLFDVTMWRVGNAGDSYVPDSPGLTIMYFGAAAGAMIVAHRCFRSPPQETPK